MSTEHQMSTPGDPHTRKSSAGILLQALLIAAPLALIALTFRSVNIPRVLALVRGIGLSAALILGPYVVLMLFDSLAWQNLLANLGRALPFGPLLAIRTAVETFTMSFSGGTLVADGLTPYLLKRRLGVPHLETIASVTTRRSILFLTQSIVQGLGVVLGFGFLGSISASILGAPGLPWLLLVASLVMLAGALYFMAAVISGKAAVRLHATLTRIPSRWLRLRLHRIEEHAHATDRFLARTAGFDTPRLVAPHLLYGAVWFLETFESYVMLRCLGVDVRFVRVWAFVPAVILLRQIVFFIPGGLGLQEVSYLAFFRAAGFPQPTDLAAAFALLKRFREALWIATGFLVLTSLRGPVKKLGDLVGRS